MDINIISVSVAVGGFVLANFALKLGKAAPVLKRALSLINTHKEAAKDGKLTVAEKADLYDKIQELLNEAYSIIRGLFPNRG